MSWVDEPVKKLKTRQLLQEAEQVGKSTAVKTRLAQGAVATPVALGAGYGASKIYEGKKKGKEITREQAKQIYRAGESGVVQGMLKDPRFPIGAKLRILEGEGVIKTSAVWNTLKGAGGSAWDILKGTRYKKAIGQKDNIRKQLDVTSDMISAGNDSKKVIGQNETATKAWRIARDKVHNEGLKT
jgi:hypothetical protein